MTVEHRKERLKARLHLVMPDGSIARKDFCGDAESTIAAYTRANMPRIEHCKVLPYMPAPDGSIAQNHLYDVMQGACLRDLNYKQKINRQKSKVFAGSRQDIGTVAKKALLLTAAIGIPLLYGLAHLDEINEAVEHFKDKYYKKTKVIRHIENKGSLGGLEKTLASDGYGRV